MNLKRTIYLVVLLLGLAFQQAHSQSYTPISGVINDYTSVSSILSEDNNNVDSVVVASSAAFFVGDTVMLHCVKGAEVATNFIGYTPGEDAQNPRNTGRYALLIIDEIIGNTIVLNSALDAAGIAGIKPMGDGEMAQLIRVRSYRYANVTAAGLSAPSWNPLTGTGGVVVLFAHGVLRLDGDINVTGDGFKGAPGSMDTEYALGCLDGDTMQYFYLNEPVWAGLKGEGIVDTTFHYYRGKGSSINGGGGGNGLLAGGGGGSNYSAGVQGGEQSTLCTPGDSLTGGMGGFALGRTGWYYINTNTDRTDRIFFGGGGGSGTSTASTTSSNGANGGGLVVIIADTIVGNGNTIRADGADVLGLPVDGAGGGGGGGGCIILDVAGYQGALNLSAVGGDGGSTNGSDTTGMGGAGGGGIYWLAGDTHPGVVANTSTGSNGIYVSFPPYAPLESPRAPFQRDDLIAPLRGFLFNPVPSEFTVCSDQDPEMIVASAPKGGDGPGTYSYQWIDSSKTQNYWDIAPGVSDLQNYDPGLLADTTYFRRVVTSGVLPSDTSFRIAIYVHPAITGNIIAANDTVCSGNAPELFISTATIGGGPTNGTYNYLWQHLPDGDAGYSDLTSKTLEPTYQAGGLITSTDYRRIAYSGVCIDTSNEQRVRVLEALTGNDITPFDTICINTIPDLIDGPAPTNGDQDDLRYQWLTSTSPGDMGSLIPGATVINYQSPALAQTTYIRRIVLSGNDDACKDTSAFVEILNVPAITGNIILDSHTLCQEDQADLLNGSTPGGGYLSQYSYTWISSTDQSNWVPATGGGDNDVRTNFDPGIMDGDTTWYRRVVESGGLELVCKDTSSFIVIEVLPSITNNMVTPADLVQCQREMPDALSGSLPGGGATVAGNDPTRVYRWEVAQIEGTPGTGNWTHPSTGADSQDYTDPNQLATEVDRWYKRIVISGSGGECTDTSNLVRLVVHSEITGNGVDAAQAICFNDSQPLRNVLMTGGEDTILPVYTWRRWLEGETIVDAIDRPNSDFLQFEDTPYVDPATLIYNYDRVVEIGACRDTSSGMVVTVMQLPSGLLTDAGFAACEKETFLNLDLNISGLTAGHFTTPWEVYLKDGVNTGIGPGSVDEDQDTMGIVLDTYGADQVTYTYEIESIRYYPEGDDYACISSALPPSSVVVDLSRRPDPQILVDGEGRESFKVCNDTAILVMDPDNGLLSQWADPTGSVSIIPGSGQDEFEVSIPDNSDDYGQYRIYAKSEAGDCAGLDSIDLYFFEQPAPANAGKDTMLFLISSVQLRADSPTAGIGTWHLTNGSGSFEDEHDPNTIAYDLGMGEENTFRWTIENGEDEGLCTTSQDVTIVLRNEVKKYNGFSPNEDMDNEYFIMQGLVYADEFEVVFLNSLGNEVRTIDQDNYAELEEQVDESLINGGLRDDEMVIWDGRSNNGNMVPAGTYYYAVTFTLYIRDYQTEEIIGRDNYEFTDYVVVVRE